MLPRRAFLHPSWLFALFALGLNDHVLKHVIPSSITGKLSDFAGLFVAPALFAAIIHARSRRTVLLAHVLVAIVFVLVKTVPFATHVFEQSLSLIVRSHVWTDPTDLVALPMVVLSWRALVPVMEREAPDGWLSRLAMGFGSVMCVATSAEVRPPGTIQNHTKHAMDVTIRTTSAMFDEDVIYSNRALPLHAIVFDGASTTLHVAADGKSTSAVALEKLVMVTIDLGTMKETFAVASKDSFELDIVDRADGGVAIQSNGTIFVRDMADTSTCAPKVGQTYSLSMPLGVNAHTIASWTRDAQGCLDVTFEEPVMHAIACVPESAWPFQKGDKIKSDYGVAVRDDGSTRTTLGIQNPTPDPSADSTCVMQDSCGALAIDSTVDVAGTKLHSGEEHVAMQNGTTMHWYAGRTMQTILFRTTCRDAFEGLAGPSSVVLVTDGPSTQSKDAGTD